MKKFLALATVALCCTGCLRENPLVPATAIPARYPTEDLRRFSEAEKAVVRQGVVATLPNPAFAEFRWTKFPKSPAETEYYCGQLNAQVDSGAWVGYRPFIAVIETRDGLARQARLIELSRDRIDVGSVLAQCRQHGLDPFVGFESDGAGVSAAAQQPAR
ncbi:hypothetical protein [Pseudorhodoplanes sp.]|uniref:hypothetical protein n=1 Tax=Pseudorhodoplanes sp. TaxID=1934341 RepID=UPI002CCE2F2B|nr:hypothetical protein [Pseudorhodoplanes sp.]HWV54449.1 hypothetical protein [Pseudorhodoplanes sp.]